MSKYYLKVFGENDNTASLKAKYDIEDILTRKGYKPLYIGNSVIMRRITFCISIFKLLFSRKISIISQYPFVFDRDIKVIRFMKKFKNIYMTSIIHDINSLRGSKDTEIIRKKEIDFMNKNDCVISHNKKMSRWMKKNGVKSSIIDLNIFDYLSEEILKKDSIEDFKNIYFAGNLDINKSKFLYTDEMGQLSFNMILFGPNYDASKVKSEKLFYKGSFKPEELSRQFKGGFGLIWDGASIDECNGPSGEYLKYNNPHKTSLYLSSGLPVIVWNKAALSEFVKDNKVGFSISSLRDIDKIMNEITQEDYDKLIKNAKIVQKKLLSGNYTMKAIKSMEKVSESGDK